MKVLNKVGDKFPNSAVHYNKDGTITHIVQMQEDDGRRYTIKRTIDTGRNPGECAEAIETRKKTWVKFGDARDPSKNPELARRVEPVDVPFRLCMNPKDLDVAEQDTKKSEKKRIDQIIKCRTCQGSHWTKECPLMHLGPLPDESDLKRTADEDKDSTVGSPSGAGGNIEKYTVPARRLDSRPSDELPSIRIANLSEETTDDDLRALVSSFGDIARMFLAKFEDGRCKGFAFVNFRDPESVELAVEKLNGYGYANLILSCEKSKRKER